MGGEDGCEGRVEVLSGLIIVELLVQLVRECYICQEKVRERSGNVRNLWLWQPCYYITVVTWPRL